MLTNLIIVFLVLLVVGILPRLVIEIAWMRAVSARQGSRHIPLLARLRAQMLPWFVAAAIGLAMAGLALVVVLSSHHN
jgi:hypothetical protein